MIFPKVNLQLIKEHGFLFFVNKLKRKKEKGSDP